MRSDWQTGFLVLATELMLALAAQPSGAQSISLDGSLGPAGTLAGPFYGIPQVLGTTVGENLFHSFERFNLSSSEAAFFQSDATIRNILGRVTGGNQSVIDGTLLTTSSAVNLFLINPQGIIFGPNASLILGSATRGSFLATSTDGLVWPDGSQFSGLNPQRASDLLRIVGDPSGFIASQRNIPAIEVNGSVLGVASGQSLLLLGGDLSVQNAFLVTQFPAAGRIELGSVRSPATVGLSANGNHWSLAFADGLDKGDIHSTFGFISAGNGGDLALTGDNMTLDNSFLISGIAPGLGFAGAQAGDINIAAETLTVTGGSQIIASTDDIGNAGNINLSATERVQIGGGSLVTSTVNGGGQGQGGDVVIKTPDLALGENSQLAAATQGIGNAGNVRIIAANQVHLHNGEIFSGVETGGQGQGGDVVIDTGVLAVLAGSGLTAATNGIGDAGNVVLTARDRILFDNTLALSGVREQGQGQGGDVVIETAFLEARNVAGFRASTDGLGDGGDVRIRARDRILLTENAGVFSSVGVTAQGQGGDLMIETSELDVLDNAGFLVSTFGRGDAGNIEIMARDRVTFRRSQAFSTVELTGRGQGGDIVIDTRELRVSEGAQLAATTLGDGDAGEVRITTHGQVQLLGSDPFSGISTGIFTANTNNASTGTGKGGNVSIITPQLQVTEGAVIDASTANDQTGGDILLNVDRLALFTGGQILTTSTAKGAAGTIQITATEDLRIAGSDPTFSTRVTQIPTLGAFYFPNSTLSARSTGTGAAGNLQITTPLLSLDDQGQLVAESNAVTGGNIFLNLETALLLRDQSLISATAGIAGGAGDGGNIVLTTPFVIARSQANNDIVANAFRGTGGNITINAQSIFNLTLQGEATLAELRQQPSNDLSASSELGRSGTIALNTPDLDPSRGLTALPANLVDRSDQINRSCASPVMTRGSEFHVTGRGGVPPNPTEILARQPVLTRLATLDNALSADAENNSQVSHPGLQMPSPVPLIEAQGWQRNADGSLQLVAAVGDSSLVRFAATHCGGV